MGVMQTLPRLLLVDDDRNMSGTLTYALSSSYEVEVALNGNSALRKLKANRYSLVVLDLNLPDIDGLIICQQLRDSGVDTPILILSGDTSVMTKICLLDTGANDYLTKPFSLGELKARLRALKRIGDKREKSVRQFSAFGVSLNRNTHCVSREGREINLRRKEFALLECLMEHAGSVVTRKQLSRHVWPGEYDLWTNTMEVHIKHLRDKIDKPFGHPLIHTVHGLGYKLAAAPAKRRKAVRT